MENLTDDELILKIKSNDDKSLDLLMERYKTLVKQICRRFFLIGGDSDDLIQEGMIGLYKATQSYEINSKASFKTFANLCISRQVKSALKQDGRLKNQPLNSGISLDVDEEDDDFLIIPSSELSPEEKMIQKEKIKFIIDIINNSLSKIERQTINLYLKGLSYNEIASKLNINSKGVENALSRARNKIINKFNNN